ncbi:helix-turn-helix domain-containing protein [Cellvibrio sp. NN19]|uniref:helix-turn-helix domain-containing protein n=1 Tax=Cellvibrio chitinivorans TaxID=3102792 RepID=UPI002B40CFBB|nr:helix-turn-helix domain-containing protein [Cellvibrio sp. NN19]
MQEFYNKALVSFLGLILASALISYLYVDKTFLRVSLLPNTDKQLQWHSEPHTDVYEQGSSSLNLTDDIFSLSFNFTVRPQAQYPFAAVNMVFGNPDASTFIDLSAFDKIAFSAKCSRANTLTFTMITFDEQVSKLDDFLSYRSPATFFACAPEWQAVELDLTRLETPQWWFDMFKVDLSKKEYKLDKVAKLNFGSSSRSPRDVDTHVQISEITLIGHNWFYLYLLGVALFILWSAYGLWLFRLHTRALISELQNKIQRDRPLVAYQQLSVESLKDKDRSAILHFMATQYANADLNLEAMASEIGVSRTKINDILKSELGFTFTGYLNKLRLTEAARLLAQVDEANIAEIAYSVGYKNVSYFNKLFKEEYHCTPKTYKSLCDKTVDDH